MVNGLANNFSSLYMQGSTRSSSMRGMTHGSSSHFEDISYSTGGTIITVPNGAPSFDVPYPQQGPFYGISSTIGFSYPQQNAFPSIPF